MASIRDWSNGRQRCQSRHFERQVGSLGVYYHASFERQELGSHAHEQVQISIPIYRSRDRAGLCCDDIEVIPSFEEHSMDWGGTREVVVLHLGASFLSKAIEAPASIAERAARRSGADSFTSQVGLTIRQELLRHGTIDEFLLETLGTILAGYLFKSEPLCDGDGGKTIPRLTYEQCRRAIEIMTGTTGRRLSMAEISSELGLSQWHFSRQFRKTTGLSPYQFLLRARVERARRLLGHGHAISEVAAMTGFADQSHMHRHFRRLLGTTPGELRKAK